MKIPAAIKVRKCLLPSTILYISRWANSIAIRLKAKCTSMISWLRSPVCFSLRYALKSRKLCTSRMASSNR